MLLDPLRVMCVKMKTRIIAILMLVCLASIASAVTYDWPSERVHIIKDEPVSLDFNINADAYEVSVNMHASAPTGPSLRPDNGVAYTIESFASRIFSRFLQYRELIGQEVALEKRPLADIRI